MVQEPERQAASWMARHYPLFLISALYSFAALDRGILTLVVDQIKRDLLISDAMFGVIAGIGFALPQFLLALPVARLVDRGNRKTIVLVSVTIWSGATAMGGAAMNAFHLLLSRIAVGAGESSNSVYHSMISDLYDRNKRSKALGVYYAMSALVSLLCFAVGGVIAEHYGWRWTLVAAGVPGLLLVIAVALWLRDPPRGQADGIADAAAPALGVTLRFLIVQRTYGLMILGNVVLGLGFGVLLFWYPAFLGRVHGLSATMVGIYAGAGIGLASLVGYLFGGIAVARLCERDERWRANYPALALTVFSFALLAGAWTDNLAIAITCFSLAFFAQASMLSGIIALTQSVLPPRMRGTGAAIFNVCSGASALGIAPFWSGLVNDLLTAEFGAEAIRYSFVVAAFVALISAAIFQRASGRVEADLGRAIAPITKES